MSATSGTRVMWHPQLQRYYAANINGNSYTTDGRGRIEHVLEADVSGLSALGFVSTDVEDVTDAPVSQYGED